MLTTRCRLIFVLQAEDGIRDGHVTGVQTCALPISEHLGVRQRLTSKITHFDPPRSFEDEQIAGPFGSFWHRHEFKIASDATVMTDLVIYRAPLGPIGWLVERIFLDRYLRSFLERRAAHLRALAENAT